MKYEYTTKTCFAERLEESGANRLPSQEDHICMQAGGNLRGPRHRSKTIWRNPSSLFNEARHEGWELVQLFSPSAAGIVSFWEQFMRG